jgi:hypothetical protein
MADWCKKKKQQVVKREEVCPARGCQSWKRDPKTGEWVCTFKEKLEKLIEKHEELDRCDRVSEFVKEARHG